MTFQDAIRTCFKEKYLKIEGRAARSEYWYFWLFYVLATIALGFVDQTVFPAAALGPLSTLFSVVIFIPFITVGVRRLHDRNLSGWWMLLMLIPIIGSFALIIIYVLPGTQGPNQFGPDPLRDDGPPDWPDDDATTQSSIPRVGRE